MGHFLIHHPPQQLLLLTLRILVVLVTFTHSQISLGMQVPLSILAYGLLCIFSYISDISDSYLVIFNFNFFQFLQFILWIYILVFVWLIVLKGWELIGISGRRSKVYWMKRTGNVIFMSLHQLWCDASLKNNKFILFSNKIFKSGNSLSFQISQSS